MMRAVIWTVATIVLACGAGQAVAGTIFTDFGEWQATVGGFQTETFNSFTEDTYPTYVGSQGSLDLGSVSLEVTGLGTYNRLEAPNTSGNFTRNNIDGTTFAFMESLAKSNGAQRFPSLVFDAPIYAFAADWRNTAFASIDPLYGAKATFSVDGQVFSFEDYLGSPGDGFLGFVSDTAFTRIDFGTVITTPSNGYSTKSAIFGMDNLRFTLAPAFVPLVNSTFELGSAINEMSEGWTAHGEGTVEIVEDPLAEGSGDGVAKLTTGSPITLAQDVDTPAGQFIIAFDYLFQTLTGTLDVYLDEVLLAVIDAPANLPSDWQRYELLVNYPNLFGVDDAPLEFRFDGVTGSEILIDDVSIFEASAVPEPATLTLLALGSVGLVGGAWRKRRNITA